MRITSPSLPPSIPFGHCCSEVRRHRTPLWRSSGASESSPSSPLLRCSDIAEPAESVLVLEGELELGAEGNAAALVQVDVLLDDLGHPKIADRLSGRLARLSGSVL